MTLGMNAPMNEPDTPTRTADDALARFELIDGPGDGETTACAATALAWIAGLAHTDRLPCAHPAINSLVIAANDADTTTVAEREALVRAGTTGMLDTWWLPTIVVAHCISTGRKDADGNEVEGKVASTLAALAAVTTWKDTHERIANLRYANLSSADLSSADLSSADLRYANLSSANLSSADLRSADLRYANLRYANLSYAYGNRYTVLPDGWKIDEDSGLIVTVTETEGAA